MKLSRRLEKILDFVGEAPDAVLADIGTDHAFLPIEAVSRGMVKSAIASDIGEGPIRGARENIASAGLTEKIKTIVADGLAGVTAGEADIISITGMGGDLMTRILTEGSEAAKRAKKLVLSPQSNIFEFRQWLLGDGYKIIKESCVIDEEKYYFILEVKFSPDEKAKYNEFELEFGKEELFSSLDKLTRDRYIEKELKTFEKLYESLTENNSDAAARRRDELQREITMIEENISEKGRSDLSGNRKSFWKGFFVALLIVAIAFGTIFGAYKIANPRNDFATSNEESLTEQKLGEIKALIDNYFIFDYEEEDLINGLLKGYVSGLGDVYSVYYTKAEMEDMQIQMSGNYGGIGSSISTNKETGETVVLKVYPGSPAEKAGMQTGDVVVSVDGEDVTSCSLDEVASRTRGEIGTEVIVGIRRGSEIIQLKMTRDEINIPEVAYEMKEDGIGYIYLADFKPVAIDQLKEALADLESQGMKGLVFDVRNNPGGTLDSVLAISNMFLEEGYTISSRKDKAGNEYVNKSTGDRICDVPMVVLINGSSASASELFSGAMKDNNRATLVGETSFGKGIVQQFFTLSDGSGIKLTTERYYTPGGVCIHETGIAPDVEVVLDTTEGAPDNQLAEAIKVLKSKL